jgi:hypothetical protein
MTTSPLTANFFGFPLELSPEVRNGTLVVVDHNGCARAAKPGEEAIAVGVVERTERCKHCALLEQEHGPDKKCLFEATHFERAPSFMVTVRTR